MNARKIIVIDKEIDSQLGAVCSAALKISGLELLEDVNALIRSIKDESMDQKKLDFDE